MKKAGRDSHGVELFDVFYLDFGSQLQKSRDQGRELEEHLQKIRSFEDSKKSRQHYRKCPNMATEIRAFDTTNSVYTG